LSKSIASKWHVSSSNSGYTRDERLSGGVLSGQMPADDLVVTESSDVGGSPNT